MNLGFIPGSAIKAKSTWPLPDHSGIVYWPLPDGTIRVIDNSWHGVRVRALREFAGTRPIEVQWAPRTAAQQQSVLNRASGLIGHRYDLVSANCEHFVHWVITGRAESPQLKGYIACLGLLGAFMLLRVD